MRTIAITIDDAMLQRLDRVTRTTRGANRSKLVREAVADYLARREAAIDEEREMAIVRRHRVRLAREAAAAVKIQARS